MSAVARRSTARIAALERATPRRGVRAMTSASNEPFGEGVPFGDVRARGERREADARARGEARRGETSD